jgi:hypothetical protein
VLFDFCKTNEHFVFCFVIKCYIPLLSLSFFVLGGPCPSKSKGDTLASRTYDIHLPLIRTIQIHKRLVTLSH